MKSLIWASWLLLLAVMQSLSGLLLLALSAWFIAACALAAPTFNYMLPAVGVRALALLRISSGYGQLWFGHHWLLRRVAALRQEVFHSTEDHYLLLPREAVEALNQHTEAVAARWVNWITRQAGAAIALLACVIITFIITPSVTIYFVPVTVMVAILFGWITLQNLKATALSLSLKADFRNQLSQHLNTASLWHMQPNLRHPSATQVWHDSLQQQQRIDLALVALQWFCCAILVSLIWQERDAFFNQATWLVAPLLLLNLRDWIAPGLQSIPAMHEDFAGTQALAQRPQHKIARIPATGPASLTLYQFSPSKIPMRPVTKNFATHGIVTLEGPSGIGKSSFMRACCGLQPYQGARLVNGIELANGLPADWLYLEQLPHCLTDTVRVNLTGGRDYPEAELYSALATVGLEHLTDLDQWLGLNGRTLSGGELKRLEVARALLRDGQVWFVDEPFEGLDQTRQNQLAEVLNEIAKSKLVVVAGHIQPPNLSVSDRLEISRQ